MSHRDRWPGPRIWWGKSERHTASFAPERSEISEYGSIGRWTQLKAVRRAITARILRFPRYVGPEEQAIQRNSGL